MRDDLGHERHSSKGYHYFLAGAWFLLIVLLLAAVSAKADTTNALLPASENNADQTINESVSPAASDVTAYTLPVAEPFIDDYTLNENALKAVENSVAFFKGRIKERF